LIARGSAAAQQFVAICARLGADCTNGPLTGVASRRHLSDGRRVSRGSALPGQKEIPMTLFNARLVRSFAIGFVLGAIGVVAMAGASHGPGGNQVVPAAIAAPAK